MPGVYAVIECNHIVLNCILTILSVLKVLTLSWFLSSDLPDCFLSSEFPDCFHSSVLPEII